MHNYNGEVPRPSPVTDAVRSLLLGADRHAWALDEILTEVRTGGRPADYSTVFRAISTLEREGLIERVELGDGKARYESRQDHHEHIRCVVCGEVAEVPGCVLEEAALSVMKRTGYRVEGHRLLFSGTCPACRAIG